MLNRKISTITTPRGSEGFLGTGHFAVPVIDGFTYAETNPFIFLMDDQLNLPGGQPVGGAHPHAGIETVTLILEGSEKEGFDGMKKGDMEWMTAGRGIVHGEDIMHPVRTRLLQLWLILPKEKRRTSPKWQQLHAEKIPITKQAGSEARVYSGQSGAVKGPAANETPVTIVEVKLTKGSEFIQEIPASYTAFLYIINGAVEVGEERKLVEQGQVAWMDKPHQPGSSQVKLLGVKDDTRIIFYAGEPQEGEFVQQGPFVGESREDIVRLYTEFRQGKMKHVHELQ